MEINLIGMGKSRELAPKNGIRWGVTRVIYDTDVDVLFDIHSFDLLPQKGKDLFTIRKTKAEQAGTVFYSTENYPLEEMINEFKTTFFSNSICYAIALAIYQGATKINLYGINHQKENVEEYGREKPGVDFWVGMAKGRGVEVNIFGGQSEIEKTFNHNLYGYNTPQESYVFSS